MSEETDGGLSWDQHHCRQASSCQLNSISKTSGHYILHFSKNETHVHEMYTPKPSPAIHHIYFSIFYMISLLKLVYNFLCLCMIQVRLQILTLLITDFVWAFFRAPRAVHETLPRNREFTKHETLASANGRQRVISVVRHDVRELCSA